jgi:hypothetical protein
MLEALGRALVARLGADVCAWFYAGPGARATDSAPCQLLREHGVLGLLPDTAGSDCAPLRMRETARMLLLRDDFLHVTGLLEAHGIPFLCIKGLLLGQLLYDDPTRRTCTDIDLLLHAADRSRALAVLSAHGFLHEADAYTHGLVECFRCARHNSNLELHLALSVAERLHDLAASLWLDPRIVEHAGRRFAIPSVERYLLYLLVHLARHATTPRLVWFEDIRHYITRHATLDTSELLAEARRGGVINAVWVAVTLCRALYLRSEVPDPFSPAMVAELEKSRPWPDRRLYDWLLPRLLNEPVPAAVKRLHSFGLSERWKDRIELAAAFLRRRLIRGST